MIWIIFKVNVLNNAFLTQSVLLSNLHILLAFSFNLNQMTNEIHYRIFIYRTLYMLFIIPLR